MIGKIKITTILDGKEKQVLEKLKMVEGVNSITLKDGVVVYELNEWASDYDVMTGIMEMLTNEFSLDSEPFEDEESVIAVKPSMENVEEEQNDILKEVKEEKKDEEKERKFKIIELGISLLILVVGIILSKQPKTQIIAPYVQVVAFAISGYEVVFGALSKMFEKEFFSEELLMTLAGLSAIILGKTIEATGIMLLYSIGEIFGDSATDNATKVIENLKNMCPDKVNLVVDGGIQRVDVKSVTVGSVILVKAGDKVALDGEVIEGVASVDTKALTGESVLRVVEVGNEVYSGSINTDGILKIKVTKDYENSSISKIMEIVENSTQKKSKAEKFITKFAKWYTPLVIVLAVIIAFIPPFFAEVYKLALPMWLNRAVMLLCISCPCALVVSVPLVYYLGVSCGASKGVLIKHSEHLEKLANCKAIAFDKTGTLTEGEFTVTKIISSKDFKGEVIKYCAVAETYSNHPLAKAVLNYYKGEIDKTKISEYKEIAGRGISVKYDNDFILCGNYKLMEENEIIVKENQDLGMKLYLAVNGKCVGIVVLNDKIREKAYGTILELYDTGVENTIMLTGDNKEYSAVVRKELKMKQSYSGLLPEDKVNRLEEIIKETNGTVAYVGDGINDAPVLSRADVGFSMGGLGSEIAINGSDVVITDDDLSKIPYTIKLAKRTQKIAKQNIIASIGAKFVIMVLSVFGLSASLWLAIGADVGVLILATINSLRNQGKIY